MFYGAKVFIKIFCIVNKGLVKHKRNTCKIPYCLTLYFLFMDQNVMFTSVHHGRNVKRLREMLGVKQEVIASALNISQQAVSEFEKKATISDEILERISNALNIPVEVIKNFNEAAAINIIANTFDNASFISYQSTFNQMDKMMEMLERLIKADAEKDALLNKLLSEKSKVE